MVRHDLALEMWFGPIAGCILEIERSQRPACHRQTFPSSGKIDEVSKPLGQFLLQSIRGSRRLAHLQPQIKPVHPDLVEEQIDGRSKLLADLISIGARLELRSRRSLQDP